MKQADPKSNSGASLRVESPQRRFQMSYNQSLDARKAGDEEAEAAVLKQTVLEPFFDHMREDHETIFHLQGRLEQLEDMDTEYGNTKRNAQGLVASAEENNGEDLMPQATDKWLASFCDSVLQALNQPVPSETIQLCGLAPLQIIGDRPRDVMKLAYEKLHTWPYRHVPRCWRRLYEEAALYETVKLLHGAAKHISPAQKSNKRPRLDQDSHSPDEWLAEIVRQLDSALVVAGAPGRKGLIESVLRHLEEVVRDVPIDRSPRHLRITAPQPLETQQPMPRAPGPVDHEMFQLHMNNNGGPLIISHAFDHWPARERWQDLSYLLERTLNGHRLIPVEVGTSYVEESWSQEFMPFREFTECYLLPEKPPDVGYLAQHDLFAQIPALKDDINVPEYCWTTPPPPSGAASKTYGLSTVPQLEEPLINAWLGPKGTKSPLHTDPYHNILCQVVGYKYVRLYPPEESSKLYPDTADASGISIENTSKIDVYYFRPRKITKTTNLDKERELRQKFPLFTEARYVEGILAPGECLYLPLGYWHYVESLTTSFSVSFWWN